MGFGMAVMAAPASAVRSAPPAALVALFAAAAAWELWLVREHRSAKREAAHHLHHAVGALAMVYMALAMAGGSGGGHHSSAAAAAGIPLLTGVLLAYFAVYVLRSGVRLLPAGTGGAGGPAGPPGCAVRDEPGFALACRLAMGTGMIAMLVTL
jgi:hypothetical protein